jgi:hypothetical protein
MRHHHHHRLKKYNEVLSEISHTKLGAYIAAAGESIKKALTAQPKKDIKTILKRSAGIKAAKSRPLPFYDNTPEKFKFLVNQYGEKLRQAGADDHSLTLTRLYHADFNSEGQAEGPLTVITPVLGGRPLHDVDALKVVQMLAHADPTPNHEYLPWIARLYANKNLRAEDMYPLMVRLSYFHANKARFEKKDIESYRTRAEFNMAVATAAGESRTSKVKSGKKFAKDIKAMGAVKLVSTPNLEIIELKTYAAMSRYCAGSEWCFSTNKGARTFNEYKKDGPLLLLINKQTKEKFALHASSGQFMDVNDEEISAVDLHSFEVMPEYREFMKSAIKKNLNYTHLLSSREFKTSFQLSRDGKPGALFDWKELKAKLLRDPKAGNRFLNNYDLPADIAHELKDVFLTKPSLALRYALQYTPKVRDPAAEKVIAKSSTVSYEYLRNSEHFKGLGNLPSSLEKPRVTFEAGESAIAKNPALAYLYHANVLVGQRFLKGERGILSSTAARRAKYIYNLLDHNGRVIMYNLKLKVLNLPKPGGPPLKAPPGTVFPSHRDPYGQTSSYRQIWFFGDNPPSKSLLDKGNVVTAGGRYEPN